MEYERIHKVQTGILSPSKLSPSKLRTKLVGPHHNRKKGGSNSNSARTSPSRLEDTEFVKNSLLSSKNGDFDDEASTSQMASLNLHSEVILAPGQGDQTGNLPKEKISKENGSSLDRAKLQQFHKAENINLSAIHPMRAFEDENLDYDSNASSSSFEFHKERSAHNQFTLSFSRPMSSKWDDAEKWIVNRQIVQPNYSKKSPLYNQPNRMPMTNPVRVAPELTANAGRITDTKRADYCQPVSQLAIEKFSFISSGTHSLPIQAYEGNASVNQCTQSMDMNEAEKITKGSSEDKQVVPFVRSVCMRDMGTEMTPATSQEPSRTATPIGATTPLRSPTSSMPSTPRRAPASTPIGQGTDDDVQNTNKNGRKGGLSEQELKEKTRREIVALGVQLGKMNIAAWASKDAQENNTSSVETSDAMELQRIDFEKRAAVWEEAGKSKHAARYKREEIKIQAWESQQKAKLEAELRRIEQMRAQAQSKMVKKIAMARQKSEEKRSAAEARKNRDAERTTAQAEHIRRTGRLPPSHYICCGWLS